MFICQTIRCVYYGIKPTIQSNMLVIHAASRLNTGIHQE